MALSMGISRCIDSLDKLEHSVKERNDICELKNFLKILDTTLSCIQIHLQRGEYKKFRIKILLYLSHIQKLLPVFVSNVQELKPYNKKIILYLYMGLKDCLTELEKVFKVGSTDEENTGKFVYGVERALKIISDHRESALPEEWKSCLDDLLCQAFTIAKIALNIDLNEITAISQKILISSEAHMDPEIQTKHGSTCQLFKDIITNDLITLEHRVNTAVLRLVLKVFSDPNRPLKKLLLACDKAEYDRNFVDLLYCELDNHVDCILHICDFAIACCDDSKSLQKIRCCMTTLEFLDSFMVPEISMFAKDMKNEEVRTSLKFLCKLWHSEVKSLEYLLDGVIDSACFCQVTYKEVSERVIAIKKAALERSDFDVDMLEDAVKFCAKLNRHMNHTACLPNNGHLKNFSLAVNECEAVMNLYIKSKGNTIHHHSVAKRYELLAACVKRISEEFADADDSSVDVTVNKTGVNAFTSCLKFPDSVRNLPLDVSVNNTSSDFSAAGFDWLKRKYLSHVQKIKYENTGKNNEKSFVSPKPDLFETYMSRVNERKSFLYKRTPRKTENDDIINGDKEKCEFQTNSFRLSQSEAQQNCSLEITEILENLSSLPGTLSSLKLSDNSNITIISNRAPINKQEQENCSKNISVNSSSEDEISKNKYENGSILKLSKNRNVLSLISVRTDDVSDVATPDRMSDIDTVDSKIKHLKMTVYGETHI